MSETTDLVATGAQDAAGANEAAAASGTTGRSRRRGSGLAGMLLPELQQLASELGIPGTARMRKGDLVAAISTRQVGGDGSHGGANGTAVPAPAAPDEHGSDGPAP
ncbi:MAG: transcription termination factor Rho, partial [Modestobacter sp.]|nr:transcription termination factor Rho [Modestobacter sp.]